MTSLKGRLPPYIICLCTATPSVSNLFTSHRNGKKWHRFTTRIWRFRWQTAFLHFFSCTCFHYRYTPLWEFNFEKGSWGWSHATLSKKPDSLLFPFQPCGLHKCASQPGICPASFHSPENRKKRYHGCWAFCARVMQSWPGPSKATQAKTWRRTH